MKRLDEIRARVAKAKRFLGLCGVRNDINDYTCALPAGHECDMHAYRGCSWFDHHVPKTGPHAERDEEALCMRWVNDAEYLLSIIDAARAFYEAQNGSLPGSIRTPTGKRLGEMLEEGE